MRYITRKNQSSEMRNAFNFDSPTQKLKNVWNFQNTANRSPNNNSYQANTVA